MSDIFVDGIRSIAIANGVTRIDLLRLKRGQGTPKLEPEVVATLMIPVASLREFTAQLASSLEKLGESVKAKGAAPDRDGGGAPKAP